MGSSSLPVKSSTEHPARPASTARATVRATPAGSSAKQFSRSAETGSSVAATIAAAWARASSRLTEPSRRPSVAAYPELVVGSAWKPSEASSLAEPWSHGFGSSSGFPGRCRSRNRAAFSLWVVIAENVPLAARCRSLWDRLTAIAVNVVAPRYGDIEVAPTDRRQAMTARRSDLAYRRHLD